MKAIKITQETVFDILWELDKRTTLKWNGTKFRPAHKVPYVLNKDAKVLAFNESGTLFYFRYIDDSMEKVDKETFIAAAVKQFGNRPRG